MNLTPADTSLRERAAGLMTFLSEYVQLRSRPIRTVEQYPEVHWLAQFPVEPECRTRYAASSRTEGNWLEIDRVDPPKQPSMPTALQPYAVPGEGSDTPPVWRDDVDDREERAQNEAERISSLRPQFEKYLDTWHAWANEDRRVAPVIRAYAALFALHRRMEREGEQFDLQMAAGQLVWKPNHAVNRHVIWEPARITLDNHSGMISVARHEDSIGPLLEEDMLDPSNRVPTAVQQHLVSHLASASDVLDQATMDEVLGRLAREFSPDGVYSTDFERALRKPADLQGAWIQFAPALILRKRTDRSLVQAYTAIAAEMEDEGVSPAIRSLVEAVEPDSPSTVHDESGNPVQQEEILMPLPASRTQRSISERLARQSGVVVQGPPGTGKSHTIANLITDLLSKGKRILVTSQTTQALRVLHEKLPDEIAKMCVASLGNDRSSGSTLHASVQAILVRQSHHDVTTYQRDIERLAVELQDAKQAAQSGYQELTRLREVERHPMEFAQGFTGTLSEIGRQLAACEADVVWLELVDGAAEGSPLSGAQATQLGRLLQELDDDDFQLALHPPIDLEAIVTPTEFVRLQRARDDALAAVDDALQASDDRADELRAMRDRHLDTVAAAFPRFNGSVVASTDRTRTERLRTLVRDLIAVYEAHEARAAIDGKTAFAEAGRGREPAICEQIPVIREIISSTAEDESRIAGRQLTGTDGHLIPALLAQAEALLAHLKAGGKLKGLIRPPAPAREAENLLESVRLDGAAPDNIATLELTIPALRALDARARASHVLKSEEILPLSGIKDKIDTAEQLSELAAAATEADAWLQRDLPSLGSVDFSSPEQRSAIRALAEASDVEDQLAEHVKNHAEAIDAAREQLAQVEQDLASLRGSIDQLIDATHVRALRELRDAIDIKSAAQYEQARRDLRVIVDRAERARTAHRLLEQLDDAGAESLTDQLRSSVDDATWLDRLSTIESAWAWHTAERKLRRALDPDHRRQLERKVKEAEARVARLTGELAQERAWSYLLRRMTQFERENLQGYAQSLKKLGKGTGKHAPKHRRDARQHLDKCQAAIPAWIMPLYRVAETIKPNRNRFDVVIVDEASQAGIDAMFLYHLAPKMVVVGDDEQISPENVGMKRDEVERLQNDYLAGIELRSQFDAETSLFDQASLRFGERVVLREHFRCMPEIIEFSNQLSYQAKNIPLQPMRHFGSDRLRPLRSTYVPGAFREGTDANQFNPLEAETLVRQVAECVKDPSYAGKTMGVISLLGKHQAQRIEEMLLAELGAAEVLERDLRCGDAYAFQGDERDVVFLSLVATREPDRRLNALTTERDRRRFNVAASRARDQLWLFHSVQADDLSPACFRRKLIHHVTTDHTVEVQEIDALDDDVVRDPFDSIFEQRVYRAIRERGFRCQPQFEALGYRIDLVVIGDHGRLAVECDGDAFHGPDRADADGIRQRELERCGWEFVRISGGAYFRDPEKALQPLWAALQERGIRPETAIWSDVGTADVAPVESDGEVRTETPSRDADKAASALSAVTSPTEGSIQSRLDDEGVQEPGAETRNDALLDHQALTEELKRMFSAAPDAVSDGQTSDGGGDTALHDASRADTWSTPSAADLRSPSADDGPDSSGAALDPTWARALGHVFPPASNTGRTERTPQGDRGQLPVDGDTLLVDATALGPDQERGHIDTDREVSAAVGDDLPAVPTRPPTSVALDEIDLGALPVVAAEIVQRLKIVPHDKLIDEIASHHGVQNLPQNYRRLFGSLVWSASGRKFIVRNRDGDWVPGSGRPDPDRDLGGWTMARLVARAHELREKSDSEEVWFQKMVQVMSQQGGRVGKPVTRAIGMAIRKASDDDTMLTLFGG